VPISELGSKSVCLGNKPVLLFMKIGNARVTHHEIQDKQTGCREQNFTWNPLFFEFPRQYFLTVLYLYTGTAKEETRSPVCFRKARDLPVAGKWTDT